MLRIKEGFKGGRTIVLPNFLIEELKRDTLGQELYITDIGYYPHANFHYRKRSKEEASEFILIYCMEGEGWFEIENNHYNVIPNQFFILPAQQAHAYGSSEKNPWTIYWIHFNGNKASFFSLGFNRPKNITPQKNSRIKDRLILFEEIYSTISTGYNKNHMLYATTCLFHFLGSMKFIGEYRECKQPNSNSKNKNIVQLAIHYMQENMGKKIRLADIAAEMKLSVSRFSSFFEESTGTSPLRYLTFLRIQEACRLLDFSDLKISQISPLVGYEDPLYFSRLFSKTMGMSPLAYKQKRKG